MPFGVVSGVGRRIGVLYRGGDRRRGSFEVNLGRPIVARGDFVALLSDSNALFPNYFGEDLFEQLLIMRLFELAHHQQC